MAQLVGALSGALVGEALATARRQRCPAAWRPGPALAGASARRESPAFRSHGYESTCLIHRQDAMSNLSSKRQVQSAVEMSKHSGNPEIE